MASGSILRNMSGNAFSAFAVTPMLMTALAGYGVICEEAASRRDVLPRDLAQSEEPQPTEDKPDVVLSDIGSD
eukprot:6204727-Amphidinium_carterae.2